MKEEISILLNDLERAVMNLNAVHQMLYESGYQSGEWKAHGDHSQGDLDAELVEDARQYIANIKAKILELCA